MKSLPRESWTILLVLLHLFVAPCATAMVLMPADMDCEHCRTIDSPDACVLGSAVIASVAQGVAFDSGPPFSGAQAVALVAEAGPAVLPVVAATADRSRDLTTCHSGDPPLYLRLGQLRL